MKRTYKKEIIHMWKGLIQEYKEFLPVNDNTPLLTLHEGNTPLIHLDTLS